MTTDHPELEQPEPPTPTDPAASARPDAVQPTPDGVQPEAPENPVMDGHGDASSALAPGVESEPALVPVPSHLAWYVVKVQSGREETIRESIERRVRIEGLQDSFGQIVIPTEKVSEMRGKKRYIRDRKLLPGYLMVQVDFNDAMLYLFRETSGVGDFVGAGAGKKPIPMSEREVQKWVKPEDDDVKPKADDVSPYNEGDRVKVKDGMFAGMEGVVKQVLVAKGAVVVELTIFGRPVPVELEYWQVDFA